MEVLILHILKLNVIAAVVILLVKVLATLFKGRVSARWKYLIWLLITISLCVPVRLPANLALVDFKVLRSSQQNRGKSEDNRKRIICEQRHEKSDRNPGTKENCQVRIR